MPRVSQSGFILPQALLFAASLLVLATLLLKEEARFAEFTEVAVLHKRAESTLRLSAGPLIEKLRNDLLRASSATALILKDPSLPERIQPVSVSSDGKGLHPLHSEAGIADPDLYFTSATNPDNLLHSEWMDLTPKEAPIGLSLAWSAEDPILLSPDSHPPDFWPLPAWNLAPVPGGSSTQQFLDTITNGDWISGPWIPQTEPIPFIPAASPACVPIVRKLALKFGVFASGPLRNREKIVRLRFYIEGDIWNPYNRPMQFHNGSGNRATFQVVFFNLPELRLHNLSRGFSSGWISLDQAANSSSGQSGISAWVELPGFIEPGATVAFIEPDPTYQPEGLARTIHPGFPIGPGDQIEIEYKSPVGGIYASCLPLISDNALDDALAGEGWFRLEAFQDSWPTLAFPRADSGDRPFYLPGGSLSFRIKNAHLQVSAAFIPDSFTLLDPRRRAIKLDQAYYAAAGEVLNPHEWIAFSVKSLIGDSLEPPPPITATPALSLFSWPGAEPRTLLEATDLPTWPNAYLLGSPGATMLNSLWDERWIREDLSPPDGTINLMRADGTVLDYRNYFHINQLNPDTWTELIKASAVRERFPGHFDYPGFPNAGTDAKADIVNLDISWLELFCASLVEGIQEDPQRSVADFFNRGKLVDLKRPQAGQRISGALLPLRAWLRNAPVPRARGSSLVLHMAVRASGNGLHIVKAARIWLLETAIPMGKPEYEAIRFEWIDPEAALVSPGN